MHLWPVIYICFCYTPYLAFQNFSRVATYYLAHLHFTLHNFCNVPHPSLYVGLFVGPLWRTFRFIEAATLLLPFHICCLPQMIRSQGKEHIKLLAEPI